MVGTAAESMAGAPPRPAMAWPRRRAAWAPARKTVAERPAEPVPLAIRNAPTALMKDLGYSGGYVYAHDTETGVGGLGCLPESLAGERFYQPKEEGFEEELKRRLERFRKLRDRARKGSGEADPGG